MQALHFAILPYRSSDNSINPDWVRLALIDEDGFTILCQELSKSAWKDNENDCQVYWKRNLISRLKDRIVRASEKGYIPSSRKYRLDDAIYDDWYHWYYFIDGEDAHEFINYCDASQHTTHWQTRCGVVVGWKFYKKLRSHNFNESTSARLAFFRGYLTGMESNAPWDSEGMEALHCLGLDIKGGSDALRAF